MSKTILDHATEILYDRKEEKERQYGPFKESMQKAAEVASVLSGHKLSSHDVYSCLIGVKLARQGFANKYDNILDCIVYLAQMSDELEIEKQKQNATNKVSTAAVKRVKKSNNDSRGTSGKAASRPAKRSGISRK